MNHEYIYPLLLLNLLKSCVYIYIYGDIYTMYMYMEIYIFFTPVLISFTVTNFLCREREREREQEGERGWGYNDRDSVCAEENLKVCKDKLV